LGVAWKVMLRRPLLLALAVPGFAWAQGNRPAPQPTPAGPPPAVAPAWRGLTLMQVQGHPYGGPDGRFALRQIASLGGDSVVIIPFLWQGGPAATEVVQGGDLDPAGLGTIIRQAREAGLKVLVKPHLWVEGGRVESAQGRDDAAWKRWFTAYARQVAGIGRIAQDAGAEAMATGTSLSRSILRPEWRQVIEETRAAFKGRLIHVAHSLEEAEAIPFWDRLDGIGLRLYTPLGRDDGPEEWAPVMRREAERMDRLAARWRKRVWVAELGIRSAAGAARRPADTVEELRAPADPRVQAEVLVRWLRVLDRPSVEAVLIWRWFTDPARGGPQDTDYTLQGKLAEGMLIGAWTR